MIAWFKRIWARLRSQKAPSTAPSAPRPLRKEPYLLVSKDVWDELRGQMGPPRAGKPLAGLEVEVSSLVPEGTMYYIDPRKMALQDDFIPWSDVGEPWYGDIPWRP